MNWILLMPLNVLPISLLVLPPHILPISHLHIPINVLPISHLLLLLLEVLPISYPNILLLLQLFYTKIPTKRRKARWSKTKRKRKSSRLHPKRTTKTRKKVVLCNTKTKQRKKIRPRNENGRTKKSLWRKRNVI